MPDDSTDGGTDNPAFSHDEDTSSAGRGSESAACNSSGDEKTVNENGNHSFVSKHYVEPRKSPEPQFKTETRIEVPDDSTNLEKPKQNGHQNGNGHNNDVSFLNTTVTSVSSNDANDKKEQIEAVNLELVSMKPYSSSNAHQTKNQEACEVPADPYEEYFVPVNEHRKFMRGEKLYVTKDKRSTKSYWRKIVCWGCSFLIVAVIAIIAILAGTGVILTQEDTLFNSGKTSSRQFNDVKSAGSQEYIKNPPSSPPPATSTYPPWPTTDESLYRHVPKALDGVIKLDDLDWNDDMNNPKSRVYREIVDDLEKSLVKMLSLNDVMPIVKVHSISKDGEVQFRVSQPVFEKPQDNQNHLEDKFRQTGSAIGRYHVNRLQITALINDCYSGNMGCNDSCVYDYLETIFICMCPTGKSFDSNSKKCVDNVVTTHLDQVGPDQVQGRSRIPDDMYHPESNDWKDTNFNLQDHYHHNNDRTSVEPTTNSVPQTTAEPKAESEPNTEPKSEPEPSSEPQPAAEPKSEPEPAAEPESEPETSSERQPVAEPKSESEPVAEPKSEPESSSEQQLVAEPKSEPEPAAEPKSEPEPAAEPKNEPDSSSKLQPAAEPKSEPESAAEPESEPESSSERQPVAEPKSEPGPSSEPQPAAEPKSEPEPAAEPKSEPEPSSEPQSTVEPKTEPEPASEPESEPELSSERQPVAEPKSESEPSSEPQPAAEPKSEPEPAAEPKSEPKSSSEPQSTAELQSELEPAAEPKSKPKPSSEPEPTVEPKTELEPASEPKSESEPSSKTQPIAEPKSEPEHTIEPEPPSESQPIAEPKSESEPAAEPEPSSEPQPIAEPNSEPESTAEPKPFSEPQQIAEPKSEPEPAAEPETSSEPQLIAEPKSEPEPAIESESSSGPQPIGEPKSEPEPAVEPRSKTEPSTKPQSITEVNIEAKPASVSQPIAESKSESGPSSEPQPAEESKIKLELSGELRAAAKPTVEPKSETESISDMKVESGSLGGSQPDAETTTPVPEPENKLESTSDITKKSESSRESISNINEFVISSSTPATVINSTSSLASGGTIENSSQSSAVWTKIDELMEPSKFNNENEKDIDENSTIKSFSMSSETTMISNEPSAGIRLNEVTTQMNTDNQSSTEKSASETDIVLGQKLVKKGPRHNKDKQDTWNPVVNASGNIEQSNDSFTYNIKLPSNIENPNIHNVKTNDEKNQVSPEEQYNDITDDFIPKGFSKNDIEISNEEKKIQKIYKENKNNNYTKSKVDSELVDKLSSKFSTTTQTIEITDKRVDDPNMTSQIPILPIEIQLELSTTENADKAYPQATSQEIEKEMISTTTLPTKTINTEGKTTEQIPILPEELQTTMTNKQEHHTEPTLSIIETDKKTDGLLAADNKNEEVKDHSSTRSNENNSSVESTTFKEVVDEDLIEKTTIYDIPSESSIKDTVKPVFESISDDTMPQNFEYKYLLTTTTEKADSFNVSQEMTEQQLRVIPLEEKESYMSVHRSDEPVKIKKEKELNFNIPADNGNNVDRKSSRTVDDDNIPKLISGSSSDVDPDEGLKTIFISPYFNASKSKTVIASSEKKINSTDAIKYPNFIPVSEEIDESDYHFTESQFQNNHDIATDMPDFLSKQVKNNTDVEQQVLEPVTELLQAVESSTNKTLLLENAVTKNEIDGDKNKNVEQTTREENKVITSTTSEPEFLGIPVAIVTSEQEVPKQIFFSKCKSGQFQCINGTSRDGSYCVDLSSTCDSENDCSDGSDEFDCEKEGCPGNFQCASGQCLKRHLVCNGIADCDDGSDENECSNWKCHSDEFQCPNGRCIPVLWQCDGRPDCENHADEYSCSESCGNDEYLCPTEKWCIPQTWRCNGVPECVNGEDEKLCECAVDQFKCETGGCIPTEQFCDGFENCPDRSDEWNCLGGFNKNSSIGTQVDKENHENEFSTTSSPIMIRQSNGEQRYICSDEWTDAFSDQYCRSLGFAASESTQFMDVGTDKKLLRLITKANPNSSIVLNLDKIDACNSNKIVEVSCQEFSCGSHESAGPTARLVGGTPATEGQWSSVALLKEPKYGTSCTASIVSPMHALASYSCIYSNRQNGGWQLFVGGNLLKPNKVKNIVPYPQVKYNQFLYNNDIALVELSEPLVFSRNVSAACLPNQSFQPPQLCVTVGWGFPANGEIGLQQYLKFLPVPTYNSEECNATSHYAGFITKSNICAGFTDTDKGPCYNDEGAPLMCVSETGRWEIQGLLSYHSRCSRGHPAIYSSLAPALSWLRNSVPALQAHS